MLKVIRKHLIRNNRFLSTANHSRPAFRSSERCLIQDGERFTVITNVTGTKVYQKTNAVPSSSFASDKIPIMLLEEFDQILQLRRRHENKYLLRSRSALSCLIYVVVTSLLGRRCWHLSVEIASKNLDQTLRLLARKCWRQLEWQLYFSMVICEIYCGLNECSILIGLVSGKIRKMLNCFN